MKQVFLRKGAIYTSDICAPRLEKDMVLVRTSYSCISAGTEMSGLTDSATPLIKRILGSPELLHRGLEMLKERGIKDTWNAVQGKVDVGSPMGYSASGIVIDSGTDEFRPGDRVACMGVGYANHAGIIIAPKNLTVRIPDGVTEKEASTAALGCIAMQGVRQADVKLGEYVVICGMGILGQLASRFAKASGATVIATDIDDRRLHVAKANGISYTMNAKEDVVATVNNITGGHGADSVILTAATGSSDLVSQAFNMCRRKGKVVLVGVAGMNLKREDMYKKELSFLISTSYGPGRYDSAYEEGGVDYPYGYVRFTEKRNLESYLRLISEKKIAIDDIIEQVYTADKADEAYAALKTSENRPLIVLLKYDDGDGCVDEYDIDSLKAPYVKPQGKILKIAICGAGGFAKGMHLPNLLKYKDKYQIYAIQSRTGSNAENIKVRYGAEYATTDFKKILADKNVDIVMICTRHNLHAQMAVEALKAGKAVFVEKPMGLNIDEADKVLAAIKESGAPFMVGYNRRFSKYACEAKKHVINRVNPMIVSYRMNAGFIPKDSWIQSEEGGGRIVGEGCHIVDLFNFLTDSEIESYSVNRISPKTDHVLPSDNCIITLKYKDGSVCTLTYTGQGNKEYGKEYCEIFCDGKTIVIDDYKSIKGYGVSVQDIHTAGPEKGQYEELDAFYNAIVNGDGYPIPIWQLEQTAKVCDLCQNFD